MNELMQTANAQVYLNFWVWVIAILTSGGVACWISSNWRTVKLQELKVIDRENKRMSEPKDI